MRTEREKHSNFRTFSVYQLNNLKDFRSSTKDLRTVDSIAGLTEEGRYERNYLTVYELMTHTDDISTEDLYQYSTVGAVVTLEVVWIIRIYHECEGRMEKSVLRIYFGITRLDMR